jgi:hypothetical protein
MSTWGLRGTVAAVGVAAVIASVGGAAVYAATDSGPRMMGMHGGPGPAQGERPAGGAGHDASRASSPDSAALHGEFVEADGSGGFTTIITQTGRVTAISASSVTARSDDGYVQTYVIPDGIPAGNRGGILAAPPFVVNDDVTIRATRIGPTASVTAIDYARTEGGPAGPPSVPDHP